MTERDVMLTALAEKAATITTQLAPNKRVSAFAEVIIESINPNRLSLELFNRLFMPTRELQPGDQLVRRVRDRGVPVRVMVPGTQHLASQMVPPREVMAYAIDYLIAKVGYNLWELQRGELGTVSDFRQELQDSIMDVLVAKAFQLLATVWSSTTTPTNYATVTPKINAATFDAMIETILDQAGTVRSIVGTRKALLPVYEFAGIREHVITGGTAPTNVQVVTYTNVLDEWSRTNRLSSYRGIPLVELPQVYERSASNFNKRLIPDDIILFIGDDAGSIILYGPFESQEHIDTSVEPPNYTLAVWRGYGMIVDYPERIGIVKIV